MLSMLQYTRDAAIAKCDALSDRLGAAAPLPRSPLMSIGGVVNHMRWVEHSWVESRFVGEPDLGPWTDESPDQEFIDGSTLGLGAVLDAYRQQAERTDKIIAEYSLDDRSQTPLGSVDRPTLRWVLLHLVEENARHNRHLDLLREFADGTTGD